MPHTKTGFLAEVYDWFKETFTVGLGERLFGPSMEKAISPIEKIAGQDTRVVLHRDLMEMRNGTDAERQAYQKLWARWKKQDEEYLENRWVALVGFASQRNVVEKEEVTKVATPSKEKGKPPTTTETRRTVTHAQFIGDSKTRRQLLTSLGNLEEQEFWNHLKLLEKDALRQFGKRTWHQFIEWMNREGAAVAPAMKSVADTLEGHRGAKQRGRLLSFSHQAGGGNKPPQPPAPQEGGGGGGGNARPPQFWHETGRIVKAGWNIGDYLVRLVLLVTFCFPIILLGAAAWGRWPLRAVAFFPLLGFFLLIQGKLSPMVIMIVEFLRKVRQYGWPGKIADSVLGVGGIADFGSRVFRILIGVFFMLLLLGIYFVVVPVRNDLWLATLLVVIVYAIPGVAYGLSGIPGRGFFLFLLWGGVLAITGLLLLGGMERIEEVRQERAREREEEKEFKRAMTQPKLHEEYVMHYRGLPADKWTPVENTDKSFGRFWRIDWDGPVGSTRRIRKLKGFPDEITLTKGAPANLGKGKPCKFEVTGGDIKILRRHGPFEDGGAADN